MKVDQGAYLGGYEERVSTENEEHIRQTRFGPSYCRGPLPTPRSYPHGVEVTVSVEIRDTSESVRVISVPKKQQHVKLRD